jgi:hypothetical protein
MIPTIPSENGTANGPFSLSPLFRFVKASRFLLRIGPGLSKIRSLSAHPHRPKGAAHGQKSQVALESREEKDRKANGPKTGRQKDAQKIRFGK